MDGEVFADVTANEVIVMSTSPATASYPGPASDRQIFGHPAGLAYIVFTEAFERFSFYGMQALLVLYMVGHLLLPGAIEHVIGFAAFRRGVDAVFGVLPTQALATQIFGLYVGLIYFVPVFGGLAGDRWLGQRKAVIVGAVLMALGHFLMVFEPAFLFALTTLIVGAGLLKGNLAAQVGALYDKADQKRDAAFSIYTVSINVGAFVAPLVCGSLGELYGWHYGFGAAGVGMLIGLAIYLSGSRYLPPDISTTHTGRHASLKKGDAAKLTVLIVLFLIAALFWTSQSQVWDTYPLWIRDRVDRGIFGTTVPITWFQSLELLRGARRGTLHSVALEPATRARDGARRSCQDRHRLFIVRRRLRVARSERTCFPFHPRESFLAHVVPPHLRLGLYLRRPDHARISVTHSTACGKRHDGWFLLSVDLHRRHRQWLAWALLWRLVQRRFLVPSRGNRDRGRIDCPGFTRSFPESPRT